MGQWNAVVVVVPRMVGAQSDLNTQPTPTLVRAGFDVANFLYKQI